MRAKQLIITIEPTMPDVEENWVEFVIRVKDAAKMVGEIIDVETVNLPVKSDIE